MPRNIPWLSGDGSVPQASTSRPKAKAESRPRRKLELDSDDSDRKPHQTSPSKKRLKREDERNARTPSTSPPPAPPSEEYMRPGFDKDDLYRMVEDEFYTVAQKFTSHLHFAEYQRLKKQTKEKTFESILSMRRPVDDKTTLSTESKRKRDAKEQAKKAGKAIKDMTAGAKAGTDDTDDVVEDDDEPWRGTHLQGLMLGQPQKSRALVGLEGVRSETKAAKGFGSPRKDKNAKSLFRGSNAPAETTGDEDSDDLGGPLPRLDKPVNKPSTTIDLDRKVARVKAIFSPTKPPSSRHDATTKSRYNRSPSPSKTKKLPAQTTPRNPPPISLDQTSRHATAGPSSRAPGRRAIDLLDDFDPGSVEEEDLSFRRKDHHRQHTNGDVARGETSVDVVGKKDKSRGKGGLDEIPLFLSLG